MATENLDVNVNVNTTQAQRNLTALNKSVQGLEDTFGKLKNAIAGIAITNIITNVNDFARSITSASSASGIAITTINSFSNAVGTLGGNAQMAVGDVIDFVAGLKDAKNGSAGAQVELQKVGVTLQDLATLSNEDIFKKTIKGLAQIEDASTRNALAVKMLGKNFKDLDVRQVAGAMGTGVASGANVSAINAASEASKALTQTINNFQSALLNVLEPLNKALGSISLSVTAIESLIRSIAAAAAAFVIFTKVLPAISTAFNALIGLFTGAGAAAAAASPILAQFAGLLQNLKILGLSLLGAVLAPLTAIASLLKGKFIAALADVGRLFGFIATGALAFIKVIARFAGIIGVIYAVAEAVNVLTKQFFNFDIVGAAVDKLKQFYEFGKKILGLNTQGPTFLSQEEVDRENRALLARKKIVETTAQVIDANRGLKLEIDKTIRAYKQQGDEASKAFKLQTSMMGLSEEQQLVVQETANLESQYIAQINAMREKYISMQQAAKVGTDEEKAAFAAYASVHFAGMAQMSAQYTEQQAQLKINIDERLKQLAIQKQLLYDAELLTKTYEAQQTVSQTVGDIQINAIDKVRQMQNDYQQSVLPGVYQQLRKIADQENEIAIAAKRRVAEQFENDPEGLLNAIANIDAATKQAIAIQQEAAYAIYENQRSFEYGWAQAYNSYVDDATNAAKQAQQAFSAVTGNMEKAIDNFVTTGKFSFSDLARSIIQDLIRIELKAQATSILKGIGGSGTIFSAIGSLFGFANGGNPPINKPSIVGENGPELFVPRTAGTIIPNHALAGAGTGAMMNAPITNNYITNNISAVDAKSVAQLFAENRKTLLGTVQMAQKELPYSNR